MELYLRLLKRSYPGIDVTITEEWKYENKHKVEYKIYTLTLAGKPIKKFYSFKEMVDAILYLVKDELEAEV